MVGTKGQVHCGGLGNCLLGGTRCPGVRDEVLPVPEGSSGAADRMWTSGCIEQVPPDTAASPGCPRGRCRGCGCRCLQPGLWKHGVRSGCGFLSVSGPRPLRMPPRRPNVHWLPLPVHIGSPVLADGAQAQVLLRGLPLPTEARGRASSVAPERPEGVGEGVSTPPPQLSRQTLTCRPGGNPTCTWCPDRGLEEGFEDLNEITSRWFISGVMGGEGSLGWGSSSHGEGSGQETGEGGLPRQNGATVGRRG